MNSKSAHGIRLMRVVYFMETGGALAADPATVEQLLGREYDDRDDDRKPGIWSPRAARRGIDGNRLLGLLTMISVSAAGWTAVALLISHFWR